MLIISRNITIAEREIDIQAIRAQGAGGQNVNKIASAIHLRFDIRASSLPDAYKERLLALNDQRITKDGIVVIKAQQYRTQEQNRIDALHRLKELILCANKSVKKRRPTQPSFGAKQRRLDSKAKHSAQKAQRRKTWE